MKSLLQSMWKPQKSHLEVARIRFAPLITLASVFLLGHAVAQRTYTDQGGFGQAVTGRSPLLPVQQAIPAVPLTAIVSPGGEFAASVPRGWSISPSAHGDSFFIAPSGHSQPSAYFIVVDVSDLRYLARITACSRGFNPFGDLLTQCTIPSIRIQLGDSSREWTPAEGLGLILQGMQARGAGRFGVPYVNAVSSSTTSPQAFYRVVGTTPQGQVEHWGIVTMIYMPNPMLYPRAVTSFALIAGCSAPPDMADSLRRTCAGIIDSYRVSPAWEGRLTAGIINMYEQEGQILLRMGYNAARGFQAREQMINTFGQSMQSMQWRTFQAIQSRNYLTGQEWIATFGGNTLMKDPVTGALISVPYGYPSYGIDDRGLTSTVLAGQDERPGASIGNAVSTHLLVPPG